MWYSWMMAIWLISSATVAVCERERGAGWGMGGVGGGGLVDVDRAGGAGLRLAGDHYVVADGGVGHVGGDGVAVEDVEVLVEELEDAAVDQVDVDDADVVDGVGGGGDGGR